MKKILLTSLTLLLILGTSPVFAQSNIDIVPDGADQFFFSETAQGLSADGEKALEKFKKEAAALDSILKGKAINSRISSTKNGKKTSKSNPEYAQCESDRKAILKTAKPTKPSTSTKKTPAPSTNTNSVCRRPGLVETFQFFRKQYQSLGCTLGDVGNPTFALPEKVFGTWQKTADEAADALASLKGKDTTPCEQIKRPASQTASKKSAAQKQKCTEFYYAYQCMNRASEVLLIKKREIQHKIKQLENPEYYKCQFKEEGGKLVSRNKVCVELTERIGSTRVIGAETGLGLLKAYLALIYRYLVIIIGVFAVGVIIYNGVRITAGGSEGVETAKTGLKNALVGLVVLLLASAILAIINPNFFIL